MNGMTNKLMGYSYTIEFYSGINISDVKLYSTTKKEVHSILLSDQKRPQTSLSVQSYLHKIICIATCVLYMCRYLEGQYRWDLEIFHFYLYIFTYYLDLFKNISYTFSFWLRRTLFFKFLSQPL